MKARLARIYERQAERAGSTAVMTAAEQDEDRPVPERG
jgi:hypothetical protein